MVLTIGIAFATWWSLDQAGGRIGLDGRKILSKQAEIFLEKLIGEQAAALDVRLAQAQAAAAYGAVFLSENFAHTSSDDARINKLLSTSMERISHCTTVYFIDSAGHLWAYLSNGLSLRLAKNFNLIREPFFPKSSEFQNNPQDVRWSKIHVNPLTTQYDLVVDAVAPVVANGVGKGYIGVSVSLTYLIAQFNQHQPIRGSYTFFVDTEFQLIGAPPHARADLAPPEAYVPRGVIDLSHTGNPELDAALKNMVLGESSIRQLSLRGEPRYLAYHPLNHINWRLGLLVPVTIATAASRQLVEVVDAGSRRALWGILFWAVILLIVALAAGQVLIRQLTSPIRHMVVVTESIAGGDFQRRVEFNNRDEIGHLAIAFNAMADRIQTMIHDLERVNGELELRNKELEGNINERKQAEDLLAAEKERLAVTLKSIGDGVIAANTEGDIVLMNKVAEELTGWKQAEARGKPLSEVFCIVDERTREVCENPVFRVLQSGGIVGLAAHAVLLARDGTERIVEDSGAPIYDKESHIVGVVLVFRDVTEKRKIEEELLKIQKLESVGVLAGGIAHDFNNILTGIIGNVSLAKLSVEQGDPVFGRLAEIEKASLRARDLTNQLLTFSKGGAPVKKIVSIGELIRNSAEFALRGSNCRCDIFVSEDLWNVEVDMGQIRQVIHNLLINASQSMPEGGIIDIRAENIVVGETQELPLSLGEYVKISVRDRGIGIPKEDLPKIFDPYFTTKQKGSGLGLATSYSIIRNHQGYINAESNPGFGTTFCIYLPVSDRRVPEIGEIEKKTLVGKGKILLMDDDEMVRDVVGEMLHQMGYKVDFAREGEEALHLYQKAKESSTDYDAVILDLTIPGGMGGKETIQRLLEMDPNVKAIVSSGYSHDPIMSKYREYGFSGVITKPYLIEELSRVVHDVIRADAKE